MKKKVMFYINVLCFGGAERVVLQLARHFQRDGYEAVVVTSCVAEPEYPMPKSVRRIVLEPVKSSRSVFWRNIVRISRLRQVCKDERPDILISFMKEPCFRALIATKGLPIKRIVSVRNDPNREYAGKVGRFIGKVILPTADGCVFQTEEAKQWFPQKLQRKSATIFNEVTEEFFFAERKDTHNVVAVGKIGIQKNHDLLIRAFSNIADKHPNENLIIYGDGDRREEIEHLITSLDLKDRVILMGRTTDVISALEGASIFVLSSDYEGMPNALMEALAVGVPSISTDCPCGGPKMLIENEKNGLLVPVGDEEALAEAMDRLLSDRGYAEKLGAAAKESAKRYMPDKIFGEWKSFIEEIVYEH